MQECYHEGRFWDELACLCFTEVYCMIMCSPGQDMDPMLGCACVEMTEIRKTYYPNWATPYDISVAFMEGFEAQRMYNRIRVCPVEDNTDKCENGFFWNELACECFALG